MLPRLPAIVALLCLALILAANAVAADPVKVMPLGDSLTLGAYAAGQDGSGGYRAPLWNRLVANNYAVDFVGSVNGPAPAGVDPNHEGHGGWRIDDLTGQIDGWLANSQPDVILLLIGANDIIQGYTVDVAQGRLNTLLDHIFADRPAVKLLIANLPAVPQPNFYNYDLGKIQDFNSRLPAIVAARAGQGRNIALVDQYGQSGLVAGDFGSDGVHPTDAGYAKMANVWYPALSALLVAGQPYTPPAPSGTFYRAINLGGGATTIDGHAWEAGTASGISSTGGTFANSAVTLSPATDAARTAMIRCSAYDFAGSNVTMAGVPSGIYDVYCYVWEDNNSETVDFTVNGLTVKTGYATGAAGHWDRLGPWSTTTTAGSIAVRASGVANLSGLEVWRTGDVIAPPPPPAPGAPLALLPANPRYFAFRGQPTVLVTSGEHYGALINADFDYVRYLDHLQQCGFNLTRIFATYAETWGEGWNTLNPAAGRYLLPWARSGTPGFSDGGNKFDLSRFDDAYWNRLTAVAQAASDRGIVIELDLFGTIYGDTEWSMQAFNPGNNINGIGGGGAGDLWNLGNAAAIAIEDAYVRKAMQVLNHFDNVYFELCNEPYFGSFPGRDWHQHVAAVIIDEESRLPNRHLIAHNIANASAAVGTPVPGVSIFNFHYASPPTAVAQNYGLGKPIGFDENGFRGQGADPYRREAWQFMLAGGSTYDGLDWCYEVGHEDGSGTRADINSPRDPALWAPLKALKEFMNGLDLAGMSSSDSIIAGGVPSGSTAHALAKPGAQVAVHIDGGSQANLVLTLASGTWTATWVDTRSGAVAKSESFDHAGGTRTLASPTYNQDIAVRVLRTGNSSGGGTGGGTTPAAGTIGIDLNGPAVTIEGVRWRSAAKAQTQGLSVSGAQNWSGTYPSALAPAADADTTSMLQTLVYRPAPPNGQGFTIAQTVANGTYDVWVWTLENYQSNARDVDLKLEGALVATAIGDLPLWSWRKYGPYRTTVADGALTLDVLRHSKGDPCIGGILIVPVAGGTGGGSGGGSTGMLPSPWTSSDIGGVAAAGSASVSGGTWTVAGSGADIWGTSDEFRFAAQPLDGDGQITARVVSQTATDQWAKAGVMIRESADPAARHAMAVVTPANGIAFQRRLAPGSASSHTAGVLHAAPYWVRLSRVGNVFTAWQSADGSTWQQVGSATIAMGSGALIGLAVTSHADGAVSTAVFDNVSVILAGTGSG